MTLAEFANVFGVLALQLRFTEADEATIRAYFEVLKECELEFVQMAATRFATCTGENASWFPKTAEWREATAKVEADRHEQQRAILRSLTDPLCTACRDTGWARNETTNRVERCDCSRLRRLELLGRRPMPQAALTAASSAEQLTAIETTVATIVRKMP